MPRFKFLMSVLMFVGLTASCPAPALAESIRGYTHVGSFQDADDSLLDLYTKDDTANKRVVIYLTDPTGLFDDRTPVVEFDSPADLHSFMSIWKMVRQAPEPKTGQVPVATYSDRRMKLWVGVAAGGSIVFAMPQDLNDVPTQTNADWFILPPADIEALERVLHKIAVYFGN